MSVVLGEDEERESLADDDDNKSVRSKKSVSVYSSVAKSIRKHNTINGGAAGATHRSSAHGGSQHSGSKRDRNHHTTKTSKKEEDCPVPTKLDLPQR